MGITFLHSADWHIGRRFRAFAPEVALLLEEARLGIVDRLAELARDHGAHHVLVAGDVLDSEGVPDKLLRQLLERLGRYDTVTWWLLPGNHDPASDTGVWRRVKSLNVPANVEIVDEPRPRSLVCSPLAARTPAGKPFRVHGSSPISKREPVSAVLLPAPLLTRATSADPTAWFDNCETPSGTIRIGLAHGSAIPRFGPADVQVPVDPARAEKASLDYLALGDWHGVRRIGPRAHYAGTPEPDGFDANGQGYTLIVRLAQAGAEPEVEAVRTAVFDWRDIAFTLRDAASVAALADLIAKSASPPERQLVRLVLSGRLDSAGAAAFEVWRATAEASLRYAWIDTRRLASEKAGDRLRRLSSDPHVSGIARSLEELSARAAEVADASQVRRAEIALNKLADLTARFREAAE